MNDTTVQRLYLMQVGSMPDYDIPIVCYLVQTTDGRSILIDTGLPEHLPEDAADFRNGQDVVQQLARIGLTPPDIDTVISTHYDIDHAGRHAAFPNARYVVQRAHHEDAATNPRFAPLRDQWDQPTGRLDLVDGDTTLLPGLDLIETSGHVTGHQSVLLHLPQIGPVLLTVDAVPFAAGFTPDPPQGSLPDGDRALPGLHKLLAITGREQVQLVIFGHDQAQWATLKQLPGHYS